MVKCLERPHAEILCFKQDIRGREITFQENWKMLLGELL